MKQKIAILGSGAMGTACANVLGENNHDVIIYGINQEELNDLATGYNHKYFATKLVSKFNTSNDLKKTLENVNYVIIAIPTKFIPDVFYQVINLVKKQTIIVNLSKGFWPDSNDFIHTRMEKLATKNKKIQGVVSLIGPSFAIDIVNKNITIINAVSNNINLAKKVKKIFSNQWFGVAITNDVIGAEIGSTFKNVLAIGSGLIAGMGYSTNTQTAFLTYGLKEIKNYALYCNANIDTVYDLCGLGDLMLTGLFEKSRNYMYGKNFFKNKLDDNFVTVEGLYALKYIYKQIKNNKSIKLPLIESLYKIIYNKVEPRKIITKLMKEI
ncbi:Glycerol-3-phosphate dehydrogenase [NAD(P)+] [Metamycoplasma alkalescens 14918]|uniref:Glycerol-3-phosphate dehydrogenase n=2 Tax=Metamycoplasma alkalescens TaxID=45363 RepID=N9U0V2_9BACT|nr:NAD(P)H-dependent glycerol-3-phosphate dehydrogenase [Metamycoplasma alkalescens]ENY54177.1 Glycerol-3-phosphate dehydrogenase [NAD(P)+] [Metamycoplasma alkalescens 14918]